MVNGELELGMVNGELELDLEVEREEETRRLVFHTRKSDNQVQSTGFEFRRPTKPKATAAVRDREFQVERHRVRVRVRVSNNNRGSRHEEHQKKSLRMAKTSSPSLQRQSRIEWQRPRVRVSNDNLAKTPSPRKLGSRFRPK